MLVGLKAKKKKKRWYSTQNNRDGKLSPPQGLKEKGVI